MTKERKMGKRGQAGVLFSFVATITLQGTKIFYHYEALSLIMLPDLHPFFTLYAASSSP